MLAITITIANNQENKIMPNYNLDEYTRGAFKRGGINANPKPGAGLVDASAITKPLPRLWDRVKSELNTLTGTLGGGQNPATFGYQMLRNAPEYYRKAVEAGNWWGGVQKKGLGYLGRGSEAYGDFVGADDFSKYGKMLGDWGLGPRGETPPGKTPPGGPPPSPSAMPLDYKGKRPPVNIPGMENASPVATPRTERTTGGTTTFAPQPPTEPAGYQNNQRYLDIARASDTDIEGRFAKMGGIEAIRGTDKTFWSPASGEEFLTKREAVAGRTGLLGPKDAAATEKEQLERGVKMDQSRIASKAVTDAANIRGKASVKGQKIASGRGRFEFIPPEVNLDGQEVGEDIVFDTQEGIPIRASQMTPQKAAKVLASTLSTSPAEAIAYFARLGELAQEQIIPLLSPKEREMIFNSQGK
jgi:hypothetical protein